MKRHDALSEPAVEAELGEPPPRIHWTFRQVECFLALAETLNFSRAAERVHITQPAFSRHIIKMEESLGLRLVDRDTHAVKLTPAGEIVLRGCHEALGALDGAIDRAVLTQRGFAGLLRLGYTDFAISSFLPEVIRRFKRRCPRVKIETLAGASSDLIELLREEQLDLACVTGPIEASDLEVRPIARNRLLAVMPESHPLAQRGTIRLADLAAEHFVFGAPKFWRHYLRYIDRIFERAGFHPSIVGTAHNSEGLFGLIASGLGITLYPDCVLNYYRRGLICREIADVGDEISTVVAWRSEESSEIVANFLSFLNKGRRNEPA